MRVGDLVKHTSVSYEMLRGQHNVGIILAVEKKMVASRYSGQATRPITEVVVYLSGGKITKWYSEKVKIVQSA